MLIQFTILFAGFVIAADDARTCVPFLTAPPAPATRSINISVNTLGGWSWFYYCNGLAHALRLAFLPQYEGDTSTLAVASSAGFTYITKDAFATAQLGLAPADKWQALGALVAIVFGGWALFVVRLGTGGGGMRRGALRPARLITPYGNLTPTPPPRAALLLRDQPPEALTRAP